VSLSSTTILSLRFNAFLKASSESLVESLEVSCSSLLRSAFGEFHSPT
jgi:hypothetical protein